MEFQDYYQILGVERTAKPKEIKKAYRKLAMQWHPDRHPEATRGDAEDRFKRINEAYEVLSDPDKRARYDALGADWEHGQPFEAPQGAGAPAGDWSGFGFSEFFERFFGRQYRDQFGGRAERHGRYRVRGADARAELHLPIGEALEGGKRSVRIPTTASCPRCGGVGFVGEHVCSLCVGVGRVHRQRTVQLTIPADLRPDMVLRLRGLGEPGVDAEPGDLLITLRLDDDATYSLRDGRLGARLRLAPWEAFGGTRARLRTAAGTVVVDIKPGANGGDVLRLRGQGFTDGDGRRGDLHVVLELRLPDALSPRQRQLLQELAGDGAHTGESDR